MLSGKKVIEFPDSNKSEQKKGDVITPDFQAIFESTPGLYLVLLPDSPKFTIVAVSGAYLGQTMTAKEKILNRGLFEVFPENPNDPGATGKNNVTASLNRVINLKKSDTMPVQKYDIRRSEELGGGFEEKFWSTVNTPVLDSNKNVNYIIHRTEDVTEFINIKNQRFEQKKRTKILLEKTEKMEAEIILRTQEMKQANIKLLETNEELQKKEAELKRELKVREQLEIRQKFHIRVGQVLADSIELDLNKLSRLVIPDFSDACLFLSYEKDHENFPFISHRDPHKAKILSELCCEPNSNGSNYLMNSKFSSIPICVPELNLEILESAIPNEEERKKYFDLEIKSFISVPVIAHGKLLGAITLLNCESDRHFSEADLPFCDDFARAIALAKEKARLYQDAKEAVSVREEVLAIVSHDLKNPLSAINLSSQLLLKFDVPDPKLKQQIAHFSYRINNSVQSMLKLITSILDFAKIQSGTFAIEPSDENPKEIIEEYIQGVRQLAEAKSIKIMVSIDSTLPPLHCDRNRVLQILSNVVGNAIKFTPSGGEINIEAKMLDNNICFIVRDTGPGISPDQLPHIFEKFWQAKDTATTGTGLGLTIAKGIVEAHHGRMWVESTPGKGSSFYFTLPTSQTFRKAA